MHWAPFGEGGVICTHERYTNGSRQRLTVNDSVRNCAKSDASLEGKAARLGQRRIEVLAQGSVTDSVPPIDQALLNASVQLLEACRDLRKLVRLVQRTGQRVGERIVRDVRANPPVRALALAGYVRRNQLPFTQAPHVSIDQLFHPNRLADPVAFDFLSGLNSAGRVADEHGAVPL